MATPQRRRGRFGVPSMVALALHVAGLGALSALAAGESQKPPQASAFAGRDLCVACHTDVVPAQQKDWHAALIARRPGSTNCEECHGPSSAHADSPLETRTFYAVKTALAAKSGDACLRCHEQQHGVARWRASDHARAKVRCWDCHSNGATPHSLTLKRPGTEVCLSCHREQAAAFELTSHHPVREGRVECSDCHDAHGRQSARDIQAKCVSCHAPQRGPFVFAHGAISGGLTDGCLDCHRPHGSPNQRLLKYTGRGLCLQCHADRALHFASRTCWASGCHSDVHGSNQSPLLFAR